VHAYIELVGGRLRCRRCATDLCAAADNWRLHVPRTDRPLAALGERYRTLSGTLDAQIVFRAYSCPGCTGRLDAEVCPASATPLRDFEITEEIL
jgi:acetone carboxylase gamma subunit